MTSLDVYHNLPIPGTSRVQTIFSLDGTCLLWTRAPVHLSNGRDVEGAGTPCKIVTVWRPSMVTTVRGRVVFKDKSLIKMVHIPLSSDYIQTHFWRFYPLRTILSTHIIVHMCWIRVIYLKVTCYYNAKQFKYEGKTLSSRLVSRHLVAHAWHKLRGGIQRCFLPICWQSSTKVIICSYYKIRHTRFGIKTNAITLLPLCLGAFKQKRKYA